MLHYVNGDLLKSDCTVVMHQANCMSIMGAGIAKAIAEKYPNAQKVDKKTKYSPEFKYGKFTYSVEENGVTVVNLYGQYNLGKFKSDEEKIQRMKMLRAAINYFLYSAVSGIGTNVNLEKIGVPYNLGCGIAGGDWNVVTNILKEASETHGVDIFIYKLQ